MKDIKAGGRKKGTPNKRTRDVMELINTKYPDFNPLLSMIEISKNDDVDINIRVSCLKEIAGYMFPKRKAIEVDGSIQQDIVDNRKISNSLEDKIDEILKK